MTAQRDDSTVKSNLLRGEAGPLDRLLPTRGWLAPGKGAFLDGAHIEWTNAGVVLFWHEVTSTAGMLEGFARLRSEKDPRILRYAQKWGLLKVCDHGLPMDHGSVEMPLALGAAWPRVRVPAASPSCESIEVPREPLSMWRYWIAQADGVLRAATRLRDGQVARSEDWKALTTLGPWTHGVEAASTDEVARYVPTDVEGQRRTIAVALDAWMRGGGVRLQTMWTGRSATIQYADYSLLGGLGFQLALVTTGHDSWAMCSPCGAPFVPDRSRRVDQRTYCPDCREAGAPTRDAKRDERIRKRKPGVKHRDRRRTSPSV